MFAPTPSMIAGAGPLAPSCRPFGLAAAMVVPGSLAPVPGSSARGGGFDPLAERNDGSLAGRRVLLVEDELMLALDVQLALEDAGAHVLGPIDDLADGLALLERESGIDAAILDIDLHGEDVFPLAERLRARGVPFLFHTGHGERAALTRHFERVTVCTKPVLTEALVRAVRDLLR